MRNVVWLPRVAAYQVIYGGAAALGAFAAPRWTYRNVVKGWAEAMLSAAGAEAKLEGAENLSPGPVVVMANHSSYLDVPALFDQLPYEVRFVAKKELKHIPFFGWGAEALGNIFVDRGKSEQAHASLDRGATKIREGVTVVVFPEGTRTHDGNLLPFKKGGFVLAIKAGVPIVPVAIVGARDVLPRGSTFTTPGTIRLRVMPPVDTKAYTLDTKEALMQRVRDAIETGLTV